MCPEALVLDMGKANTWIIHQNIINFHRLQQCMTEEEEAEE